MILFKIKTLNKKFYLNLLKLQEKYLENMA